MNTQRFYNLPDASSPEFIQQIINIYNYQKQLFELLDQTQQQKTRIIQTPENQHYQDDLEISSYVNQQSPRQKRYWTPIECEKFQKIIKYMNYTSVRGMNFELVSSYVQTRTPIQVRSHAQKYFLRNHENTVALTQEDKNEIDLLISNNHLSNKIHSSFLHFE